MDINKELQDRINKLDENLSYLATGLLTEIDRNRPIKHIEEFILEEINEIVAEEE